VISFLLNPAHAYGRKCTEHALGPVSTQHSRTEKQERRKRKRTENGCDLPGENLHLLKLDGLSPTNLPAGGGEYMSSKCIAMCAWHSVRVLPYQLGLASRVERKTWTSNRKL
jgi:hypothetical protein